MKGVIKPTCHREEPFGKKGRRGDLSLLYPLILSLSKDMDFSHVILSPSSINLLRINSAKNLGGQASNEDLFPLGYGEMDRVRVRVKN